MRLNIPKNMSHITRISKQKIWILITFVTTLALIMTFKQTMPSTANHTQQTHLTHQVLNESELNTVQLQGEAYRKLGITIETVQSDKHTIRKKYGGDIVIPGGGVVTVSAPMSGKLITLDKQALQPGTHVISGQLLYRIKPIITADTRASMVNALADAESLVKVAQTQVDATEIALKRAETLLSDLAGSQRSVDDAYAAYQLALRNLEAANVKKKALHQIVTVGELDAIDIRSPQTGIISNMFAVHDQVISAGNPIIEISSLNTLWLRVPIPVGDIDDIDQKANAEFFIHADSTSTQAMIASPAQAPLTADPLTGSIYLYYTIAKTQATLRPMQRVSVALSKQTKQVFAYNIPYSAVIFDVYGNSWVYIQQSKNIYTRKRVFIEQVSGQRAFLSAGPPVGAQVVSNGALELFALETGFSH